MSKRIFNHTDAELPEDMIAEVRRHPSIGMSILKDFKFPITVLEYVYYHHERIDGTGYPCGLTGEDIPLGAKIISVADCFDAMTTDRPYQRGKRNAEALAILKQMSGKSLCSKLVEAFSEDILERGMIKLSEMAEPAYSPISILCA